MKSKELKIYVSIKLKAKEGKSEELAQLLKSAGEIVAKEEAQTHFWVATRLDERNFYICDAFSNTTGMEAHFEGTVAQKLKSVAEDLVEGGWEQGVVANIQQQEVLSQN